MGNELKRAVAAGIAFRRPPKATHRNKNSDLLSDFVNYCVAHPHERFWQALRNWSGFGFILASNDTQWLHSRLPVVDTFHFEDKER